MSAGWPTTARAAIVAVPLNAWRTISFTPALEGGKADAAQEGQLGPNSLETAFSSAQAAAALLKE